MAVALWDVAQVTEVGNAIREVRGETLSEETKVKVSEMPAKIREMVQGEERECWLEKVYEPNNPTYDTKLFIDTGIIPTYNDRVEVKCSGAESMLLLGGRTANNCRNTVILFPFSRKMQLNWGATGVGTIDFSTLTNGSAFYFNAPFVYTQCKDYIELKSSRGATVRKDYTTIAPTVPYTVSYKIFRNDQSVGTPYYGAWQYIKIYDNTNDQLKHHLVPIVRNDWSVYILDKVTGNKINVPKGLRAQVYMPAT